MNIPGPIGVFDSGYGGLTILRSIQNHLPQYDYLYLGDNARAPYGTRSFEVVYKFTLEAVRFLFDQGCSLVILACNTASAKALRSIQQHDLPGIAPDKRVLGVIRPTVEALGAMTKTRHIGIVGTSGTILSKSYELEIAKLFPDISVTAEACPMWVPLVENNEFNSEGADYFIKQHVDRIIARDSHIDTLVLGCTHYPLLINKLKAFVPGHIQLMPQGEYVATSLLDYLNRHPEMEERCSKNGHIRFLTSESPDRFKESASIFLNQEIQADHITL
ncbi:MAG: glutamate racemase [Bacteroidaceae bacterium]